MRSLDSNGENSLLYATIAQSIFYLLFVVQPRQLDRGKERADKYSRRSPDHSVHHEKGDRSRRLSPPGSRLSPLNLPTKSRSPGDRRMPSPGYGRLVSSNE